MLQTPQTIIKVDFAVFETSQQHDRLMSHRLDDDNGGAEGMRSHRRSGGRFLKYQNFKRRIVADIRSGTLQPGSLLPKIVEMSDIHGLAPNTIRRALKELDNEGITRRVRGKGTYICDTAHENLPHRLDALGLVVNKTISEPFPSLLHGLEIAAKEMDSQILMSSSNDDPSLQGNIILQFLEKRVAGLVVVPTLYPGPPEELSLLQQNDIPVVCCHRRVEGVGTPLVSIPTYDVSHMAGCELVERGHRNVAMITIAGALEEMSSLYVKGMRDVVLPAGGTVDVVCYNNRLQESHDYKDREKLVADQLKSLMEQSNRPTALMNWFDEDAELVYTILSQLGLRIPEDISVISFGGRTRKGSIVNRLTAVTIDGMETGRLAGNLLREMIAGERPINDTEEFKLGLEFYPGETLGPPP